MALKDHQFRPGERRVGRKKGVPNKLTVTLRSVFEQTFLELQKRARKRDKHGKYADGMPSVALVDWAQDNPGEFYKIAARMVPQEMSGPGGGPIPLGLSGSVILHMPDNGRARKGNGSGNGGAK